MLEDILLPLDMAAKTTFCLNLVKLLIVTFRCALNIWSPDQLRAYSFKENVAGLKNQITFMLFRICPTNRFSKAKQNHVTFMFIKTMSHDALVQMA